MTALLLVILPIIRHVLSDLVPYWIAVVLTILVTLVALRWVLSLLIGNAVDQAVGALAADGIKGLIKTPFYLWSRLNLGPALWRTGAVLSRAGISAVRFSGGYVKDQFVAAKLRKKFNSERAIDAEECEGVIISADSSEYVLDIGGGVKGVLSVKDCDETLELNDVLRCQVVARRNSRLVDVKLVGNGRDMHRMEV